MKDRNADKDAKIRGDRWIAWEAAFVGLLIFLGLASVLYDFVVSLI